MTIIRGHCKFGGYALGTIASCTYDNAMDKVTPQSGTSYRRRYMSGLMLRSEQILRD